MVVRRDPVREWREQYARECLRIDFEPLSNAPFRAFAEPVFPALDGFCVVRAALSPGVTFRDEALVRDGNDAFALLIPRAGKLDVAHRGRDLRLARGDAALLDVCVTGAAGSRQIFGYTAVMIPRAELAAHLAHPDHAVMRRVPRGSEGLRLLRGYLSAIEQSQPSASGVRETVRRHIIDLAALAVAPHGSIGESGAGAVAAARLGAALDHIAAHFQEPELAWRRWPAARHLAALPAAPVRDVGAAAHRARDRAAAAEGLRAADGRAARGRAPPDRRHRAGGRLLRHLSHFNRLFRRRFGDTPSGVRARKSGS
jgi:hypothetical protein